MARITRGKVLEKVARTWPGANVRWDPPASATSMWPGECVGAVT
jgi:hypothetical protein